MVRCNGQVNNVNKADEGMENDVVIVLDISEMVRLIRR